MHWLSQSWASLVMHNTKRSGKNHGVSFMRCRMSGTLAGHGANLCEVQVQAGVHHFVAWGHDCIVPHVLIKRNQAVIRALHVMDSLVQRVNKGVGGTMALRWKGPNLEGEDLSGSS